MGIKSICGCEPREPSDRYSTVQKLRVTALVLGILAVIAGLALYFAHVGALASFLMGGIGGALFVGGVIWAIATRQKRVPLTFQENLKDIKEGVSHTLRELTINLPTGKKSEKILILLQVEQNGVIYSACYDSDTRLQDQVDLSQMGLDKSDMTIDYHVKGILLALYPNEKDTVYIFHALADITVGANLNGCASGSGGAYVRSEGLWDINESFVSRAPPDKYREAKAMCLPSSPSQLSLEAVN